MELRLCQNTHSLSFVSLSIHFNFHLYSSVFPDQHLGLQERNEHWYFPQTVQEVSFSVSSCKKPICVHVLQHRNRIWWSRETRCSCVKFNSFQVLIDSWTFTWWSCIHSLWQVLGTDKQRHKVCCWFSVYILNRKKHKTIQVYVRPVAM